MNPLETVKKLNEIILGGTGEGLEAIITDDIVFKGPLFKASGKEEFIPGFMRWIQTKKTYKMDKEFGELYTKLPQTKRPSQTPI